MAVSNWMTFVDALSRGSTVLGRWRDGAMAARPMSGRVDGSKYGQYGRNSFERRKIKRQLDNEEQTPVPQ